MQGTIDWVILSETLFILGLVMLSDKRGLEAYTKLMRKIFRRNTANPRVLKNLELEFSCICAVLICTSALVRSIKRHKLSDFNFALELFRISVAYHQRVYTINSVLAEICHVLVLICACFLLKLTFLYLWLKLARFCREFLAKRGPRYEGAHEARQENRQVNKAQRKFANEGHYKLKLFARINRISNL